MSTQIKTRDFFYDNAKLILIFLVVLGHFLEPFASQDVFVRGIYQFIYLFHMPAFIFISGYFSKKEFSLPIMGRLFLDYFVLFLGIQLLFVFFTRCLGIGQYSYITNTPAYIYWYLFAILIWSILLKIMMLLVDVFGIPIECLVVLSVLLGLMAGYFYQISWEFSLSRIIVFFPFFFLGYYFKVKKWRINQIVPSPVVAWMVLLIGVFIASYFSDIFNFKLLSGANSYVGMNGSGLYHRMLMYVVQLIMMIAFFGIVPKKRHALTFLGRRTLNIYILHGFFVKLLVAFSFYENINGVKIVILFAGAICLVMALGSIPFSLQLSGKIKK